MFEDCRIRVVSEGDLAMILEWRNHPDVRRCMFTQHTISKLEHKSWFSKVCHDPSYKLLIVEHRQKPIGYVQFSQVADGGVANWGFYVRPGSPKGTGLKLGVACLNYGFDTLKLHKICGQTIESNLSSIAFHKRLGFVDEGFLRDQKQIEGVYYSLRLFGLLSKEWQPTNYFRKKIHAEN